MNELRIMQDQMIDAFQRGWHLRAETLRRQIIAYIDDLNSSVKDEYDMIYGIRNGIMDRLRICHNEDYVRQIMEQVDMIVEHATDLGIFITKARFDRKIRDNLYKERRMRADP